VLRATVLLLAVLGVVVLVALSSGGEDESARAQAPELTLRQAVGQRMVFAYPGRTPPRGLVRRIARGEAAGVILFARNVGSAAAVRATVRRLQAIPRPRGLRAPLLVMVDQEGGPVRRIPGSPRRSAAAAGAAGDGAARADGRAAARTLRSAGVNLDLAPVADVARPGSAMEREGRAYGRRASVVTARATAFAAGLREGGVLATAKHFPGFGNAGVNTDDAATTVRSPLSTLRTVDGRPFRALIARGVPAVMLATAVYPALDARAPAALSRAWVTDELRGRLGFRGVTITDDLQTPAVAPFGSEARRAELAVRAGVDVPLFARTYTGGARAAEGLVAAARAGRISRAQLEAGARRVLALRARAAR
jgi:beta-N-acetylhexosaminidase